MWMVSTNQLYVLMFEVDVLGCSTRILYLEHRSLDFWDVLSGVPAHLMFYVVVDIYNEIECSKIPKYLEVFCVPKTAI